MSQKSSPTKTHKKFIGKGLLNHALVEKCLNSIGTFTNELFLFTPQFGHPPKQWNCERSPLL